MKIATINEISVKYLPFLGILFGECGIWEISFQGPKKKLIAGVMISAHHL